MKVHATQAIVQSASWIGLLSALMLTPIGVSSQSGRESEDTILRALKTRDYPAAIAAANEVLKIHPKDCKILTMRGLALQDEGKVDEGLQSFNQAIDACPHFVPALKGATQIEYARRSPRTRKLLNELLSNAPEDPTSNAMLAALDWRDKDCSSALPHFEKSLTLIASNPEANREYAACLVVTGDAAKAVSVYEQILSSHETTTIRLQLAFALWKSNALEMAIAMLSPMLESTPPVSQALILGAQIAEDNGDTPHAIQWLRQAIVQDPTSVNNYVMFAAFAFSHRSSQVGIDMLDAGLKILPQAAPLYLARGILLVQVSQPEVALKDLEEAHRLDPHLSFAADALGMMYSQQHQLEAALEFFRQYVKQAPNDPLAQYLYAEAISEKPNCDEADYREAIRAALRSVTLEPDYQPARDLLAALYAEANDPAAAAKEADEALKIDPSDESALYQKILAYRRLGRRNEVGELVARLQQLKKNALAIKLYQLEEAPAEAIP